MQKRDKVSGATVKGSRKRKKLHYSSKKEKNKEAQVEDTLDIFTTSPKLFNPNTNEVVATFKRPKIFFVRS